MKKIVVLVVVLALLTALVGCSSGGSGDTKMGLGIITKVGSSYDVRENDAGDMIGRAQADTVVASVVIDSDGKVVSVSIDTAQTAIYFDDEGMITSDLTAEYLTKKEKGADYGMIRASGIGREWYEQIAAIEEWMVGKTSAEIANMPVDGEGYPTDVDLVTRATMRVTDYIAVVLKAIENAG